MTAFGDCFGGDEEWSTGCFFGIADAEAPAPNQATADAFLAHWKTFFQHIDTSIANQYRTIGVRVSQLFADTGKVDPALNFYAYPTVPFAGANASARLPAQIALVLSLQARPDRGLASKGRMYLPGINHAVGTTGAIPAADATKVVNRAGVLMNAMNADAAIQGRLINASQGRNLGVFGDMPVNRYVQDLLVGTIYDTQRRRRNQLTEAFSTVEVTL